MRLKISFFGCVAALAAAARLAGGLAQAEEVAQNCDRSPDALTPVYYDPTARSAALAAGRGERPTPQARPALSFLLEGREPCRENRCRLHVLDDRGRRVIASVNLDYRDAEYCRSVNVLEAEKGASTLCAAPSLNVSSQIEFKGDDRDAAVEPVSITIDYQYFLMNAEKRSLFSRLFDAWQKQAAQCRSLGAIADSQARVGAWKVTSQIGAVTTIYEADRLRTRSHFRDYALGKLSVSVPFPDPVPLARDTEATGARQVR